MKLAVLKNRAVVLDGERSVDIAEASQNAFGPDLAGIYEKWADFKKWAEAQLAQAPRSAVPAGAQFELLAPRPRQVFGIGVNYADHAGESGFAVPPEPLVFTKFASCLTAPHVPLRIEQPTVDWECELVVVIGIGGRNIGRDAAWSHVAGLTIGQDISDRELQMIGERPQFSLAKSRAGFGPIGPHLVTPDELKNKDDLDIRCVINGTEMQHSRTKNMINDVPRIVSYLSTIVGLYAGDVIYSGTPSGVGFARKPPVFLKPGDVVVSTIEGLGELKTVCVGA